MSQRSTQTRRHSRSNRDKVLFYAGSKGDGSPRGWTLGDLTFMALCVIAVLFAVFFIADWLWNTGFSFRK